MVLVALFSCYCAKIWCTLTYSLGLLRPSWQEPRCFTQLRSSVYSPSTAFLSRSGPSRPQNRKRRVRCADDNSVPTSPLKLLTLRRMRRWDLLRSSLDWSLYYLNVMFLEGGGTGDSRIAAGLFERIAQYQGCSGALYPDVGSVSKSFPASRPELAKKLHIGSYWLEFDGAIVDPSCWKDYDVVVCVDSVAAEALQSTFTNLGEDFYPPNVIELIEFGPYLELRRPESPMKTWVPPWRASITPGFFEKQANASAPCDDALAVWKELPEDLAQLIQPFYDAITSYALETTDPSLQATYCHALIAFHVGGLVRFLMDSYPLDLGGEHSHPRW